MILERCALPRDWQLPTEAEAGQQFALAIQQATQAQQAAQGQNVSAASGGDIS